MKKQCLYCHTEFEAKRSTAMFDTTSCKLKYNRGQQAAPNAPAQKSDIPPSDSKIEASSAQKGHTDPKIIPEVVPQKYSHAFEVPPDTKGAVPRTRPGKPPQYVLPGRHFVADILSECLNPDCKTQLGPMQPVPPRPAALPA